MFYAEDAFAGLHVMEDLAAENGKREGRIAEGKTVKEYAKAAAVDEETGPVFAERSPVVGDAPNIPTPPFWGVRVRKDYDLREIFQYINDTALFKNQWQLKTASQEDYARLVEEKYRPIKKTLEDEVLASDLFEPKVVYGYFPAQGDGNDVIVYTAEDQSKELLRFTFPRQREGRKLCDLRLLRSESVRQNGRARPFAGYNRRESLGRNAAPLRSRRIHALSLPARPERRDRRGAGRISPQEDARRIGHCDRSTHRTFATCSIRSIGARATRLDIRRAPISKTRPSCSCCSIRRRTSACG